MKYCNCDKGYEVLKQRPFLHVRLSYGKHGRLYLTDINRFVKKTKRRAYVMRREKFNAIIYHSLANAKRATKVAAIRNRFNVPYQADPIMEISCRHCDGVVWPKNVLVQIAEQAE